MDRDNLEFLKKLLPLFIILGIIGFFTILFIFFYSENYVAIRQAEQNREVEESLKIQENLVEESNKIKESINENTVSVFEKDLTKKKTTNSDKILTGTGNSILNNDLIADYKYNITRYLYEEDFVSAKNLALEINKKYDFLDENFKDFEIFLYEVINCFDNFEDMSAIEKNTLIASLDCPELILFVFNSLSFKERMAVSENKYSEIYDLFIPNSIGLIVNRYGKDGLERAGAENVFFVTSDYNAYSIKFTYFGNEYILYYLKDKKSNQTVIMGIDDLSGDISTLKDYEIVYN